MSAARGTSWSDAGRALRARQWLHFAALPLAAVGVGARVSPLRVGLAAVVASALLAYAYGANAIADRATDVSAEKNALVGVSLLPVRAALLVAGSGALALALAFCLGGLASGAAATVLAAATVYSVGPRWKATPGLGTLLNAFLFAPLTLLAFEGVGPAIASGALAVRLVAFVPMLLQNQLLHELADADEDARAGAVTSARLLGPAGVKVVAFVLGALGVAIAFAIADVRAAAVAALALAALTAVAMARKDPAWLRAAHRRAGVVAGVIVFVASAVVS